MTKIVKNILNLFAADYFINSLVCVLMSCITFCRCWLFWWNVCLLWFLYKMANV